MRNQVYHRYGVVLHPGPSGGPDDILATYWHATRDINHNLRWVRDEPDDGNHQIYVNSATGTNTKRSSYTIYLQVGPGVRVPEWSVRCQRACDSSTSSRDSPFARDITENLARGIEEVRGGTGSFRVYDHDTGPGSTEFLGCAFIAGLDNDNPRLRNPIHRGNVHYKLTVAWKISGQNTIYKWDPEMEVTVVDND